jgi:hypothetical protein
MKRFRTGEDVALARPWQPAIDGLSRHGSS